MRRLTIKRILLSCMFLIGVTLTTMGITNGAVTVKIKDVFSSNLSAASLFKDKKMSGGSRTNYSTPEMDTFLEAYQTREGTLGSKFVSRESEPYAEFLKRLQYNKKKRAGLMKFKDSKGTRSWEKFYQGITQHQLYDPFTNDSVHELLLDLCVRNIVKAEPGLEYQQPTLILTLDNGAVGVFKPVRLSLGKDTSPDLLYFSEFERHTSEIAAFHLDRVLGFYRAPPTVGRMLSITKSIVDMDGIFQYRSLAGNTCFQIRCAQYCRNAFPNCGNPDLIEGSITISLPGRLRPSQDHRDTHPWKRSYNNTKAPWETDDNYCHSKVKADPRFGHGRSLLDLVDLSVLDFLTGNMNRNVSESFQEFGEESFIFHIDNAKGFPRAKYDCMSCLAPLRQCCLIRRSTLAKLIKLYQGPESISHLMRTSLNSDPLSPILTEPHLDALDRRLGKVIKAVSDCIGGGNSWEEVVIDDGF